MVVVPVVVAALVVGERFGGRFRERFVSEDVLGTFRGHFPLTWDVLGTCGAFWGGLGRFGDVLGTPFQQRGICKS